jgi:hypothetical protein
MTIATRLALAVAAPIAVLATAGQSASAAPPPAEPPSPDLNAVVPADFVTLTDDAGTITVGVPNSWTDVDTAPAGVDPWISAAPDFRAFVTTFDVPGVIFEAVPLTTDTATLARDTGYASVCANEEVVPYDDGVFVGSHLIDTGCGDDGTTAYHVIAANPANQAFTALLDVQITSPDEVPILDGILATFNVTPVVGSAGVPSNTAAPATQAAFPPPSGEVPVDWSSLVDDTGTIAIRVPSTWTDVDLFPCSATTERRSRRSRRRRTRSSSTRPTAPRTPSAFPARSTGRKRRERTPPHGWLTRCTTISAPPTRCRPSTTDSSPGTSSSSTTAAARRRASCESPPTRQTLRSR